MFQLRPYQNEAKNAILAEWDAGRRKTLLVLPTGTGKTCVFSAVTAHQVEHGHRVLVMAHRGELLAQAADKLKEDDFYAVVSPAPIAMTYGRLNASDRQAYLGCFQRVYAPDGKLAADTGAWPLGFLAVRAITPIGEDAYLLQTVSSSEDYTGQVLTYSKEEGLQPVEIPAPDGEAAMRMASTNTRLRKMRNVGTLKRHRGAV